MNNNRTKLLLAPIAASALVFSLAACGSDDDKGSADATTIAPEATHAPTDSTAHGAQGTPVTVGDITVADPWAREPAAGQTTSAAYATISNDGDSDVTLVSASVPFDATVELHETTMDDDGVMTMKEVPDGFVIPAGGSFSLEPGGPHIMLIDIDPADIVGEIEVTLVFDDGTEVTVAAMVRSVAGMDDMGDMEHMTDTTMADG